MSKLRHIALATAVPLALALAACSESADEGAVTGEPVAEVAPPAGQLWTDVVATTPEGGWLIGNPNAPIKLIEYGSLTCPACANFSQTGMQPLRENYVNSGRVSLEFRSVPIHGAVDLVLTRLLECGPKEAAPPLAEQLWGNLPAVLNPIQQNGPAIDQALGLPEDQRFIAYAERGGLFDFFAARGMSVDQARQCLGDAAAMTALAERMQAQSDEDGVTSTPTFFINGNMVDASQWGELEPLLQNAGAR